MDEVLSYHVMRNEGGVTMWLADYEKTWTRNFHGSAAFTSAKLADGIAKRQLGDDRTYYVMACLATMTSEDAL